MKRFIAFMALSIAASSSLAGTAHGQSDFYIRSQYSDGSFTGSHEILAEPKKGYLEAQYCNITFWVSSGTVAWTEAEVKAGRSLVLEEDGGAGAVRRIICADYSAFAKLDDLDLKPWEIRQIRGRGDSSQVKSSRIHTIRDAFKNFK